MLCTWALFSILSRPSLSWHHTSLKSWVRVSPPIFFILRLATVWLKYLHDPSILLRSEVCQAIIYFHYKTFIGSRFVHALLRTCFQAPALAGRLAPSLLRVSRGCCRLMSGLHGALRRNLRFDFWQLFQLVTVYVSKRPSLGLFGLVKLTFLVCKILLMLKIALRASMVVYKRIFSWCVRC